MTSLVYDSTMISQVLSTIEGSIVKSRKELDFIVDRNQSISSYDELRKSKNLMKLYGDAADDYSKLCYLYSNISESILDLKSVRKMLTSGETNVPQSIEKSFRFRIDTLVEQLNLFREAVASSRQGLEARVRYYNSCSYTSFDKVIGSKC